MTEMNSFYADADANVYVLVSRDVAKCVFKKSKEQSVFLIGEDDTVTVTTSKREIRRHKGCFGLLAGTIHDFLVERKKWFPDLESVARYYAANGRLPWGIRSVIGSRGWFNPHDPDYKCVIMDDTNNEVLRIHKDGHIHIKPIKQ